MTSINATEPQELTDAELSSIQGGGLGSWLRKHVIDPIQYVLRGGQPRPNVPYDPQNPFGSDPTLPVPGRPR
jgi:bacteriocin-like protein